MNYIIVNIISWLFYFYGVGIPLILVIWVMGLAGLREITRFEKYKTFYYKLNPIAKLVFAFSIMIVASITIWYIGMAMGIILLFTYLTLKDGKRKFFYALLLSISTIIGVTWGIAPYTPLYITESLFKTENVIWTWPSYFTVLGFAPTLTMQDLFYGFQISSRILPIILSSLLLIMTTTPSDIFKSLDKLNVPLALVFGLTVAMKMIPKIFSLLDESVKMQFMRGYGSKGSKFLYPVYYLIAGIRAIVPAIIYLFQGAKNIAISADTRAFRAYKTKTYAKEIAFTKASKYFLIMSFLLLVTGIIAVYIGYGRAIPYVGY